MDVWAEFDRISKCLCGSEFRKGKLERVAKLSAYGPYGAPDANNHGTQLYPQAGKVALDVVFTDDVSTQPVGTICTLSDDGDILEITVSYPTSMLSWAEALLADITPETPLILSASIAQDTPEPKSTGLSFTVDALGRVSGSELKYASLFTQARRIVPNELGET